MRPIRSPHRVGAVAAVALLAGCSTCPVPSYDPQDLPAGLEVALVRAEDASDERHRHFGEGIDPEAGSGSGTAWLCGEGWVQEGRWQNAAPAGPVTLRKGRALRFQGEVGPDGALQGTVYGLAWELGINLTGSISEEEKAVVIARLQQGRMASPLFVGQWRALPDGRYAPWRGRWYQVEQEGARVRAWEEGEQGASGWEGRVRRYKVVEGQRSMNPADHVGELEWTRDYRAGQGHGVWLSWAPGGALAREEPWSEGKLEGVAREYDAAGAVTAEVPYRDGQPEGYAWRRRDGAVWSVNFERGASRQLEITHPDEAPLRRECLSLDGRSWESRAEEFGGWRYVEPRDGAPYVVFFDDHGRRIERTRTPLPDGLDGWEAMFKDAVELRLPGGRRWMGQVRGHVPHGWGRLYDPVGAASGFEEGFFAEGRPIGYTVWALPRPDQPLYGYRNLELYLEGAPVPEERGALELQTRAEERRTQQELRDYDARLWASATRAVKQDSLRFTPRLRPERGLVEWSNGVVTEGEEVTPSQLRPGDVVWVRTRPERGVRGFLRVLGVKGDVAELVGAFEVSLAPPALVKRFPELAPFGHRFGERCQICHGTGDSGEEARYRITHVERRVNVKYVDSSGRHLGSGQETFQALESEAVGQGCRHCRGGHRVGEWTSWQRF